MPVYKIIANNEDVTTSIADRFCSMSITDATGLDSDTFEVVLADHDPQAMPIEIPQTGAVLEVYLGYDAEATNMGMFIVDEVELSGWPSQMTIRAKAAPMSKSKDGKTDLQTQKSRSWPKNTKFGDMVAKIAKEHGLKPAVSDSLKDIQLPHFDQTDESDMSFLLRIGKRYDAITKPAAGKLIVTKRGESKAVSGESLPVITVFAKELSTYSMTIATRDGAGTVIAYYQDRKNAKRKEVKLGEGEPVKRLRHSYGSEQAAKDAAQAELDKRKRGDHQLSISMPGNPLLSAETMLDIAGVRHGVDGMWIITSVTHSLDKGSGYGCDVECEKGNNDGEGS